MNDGKNKHIFKIRSATLGFHDRGFLTVMIDGSYGIWCQTIGGFALSNCIDDEPTPFAVTPHAMDFVVGVMQAAGVGEWSMLPGRTLYCIFPGKWGDPMPINTMPIGLAPLPTEKGEEFIFADWQAKVKKAQQG